jgi:hypothetical protein
MFGECVMAMELLSEHGKGDDVLESVAIQHDVRYDEIAITSN